MAYIFKKIIAKNTGVIELFSDAFFQYKNCTFLLSNCIACKKNLFFSSEMLQEVANQRPSSLQLNQRNGEVGNRLNIPRPVNLPPISITQIMRMLRKR